MSGDDRLVLDDQHVGGQFGVDLGLSLGDQALDRAEIGVEDLGRLAGREAFQRGQQKGLSRPRRDAHQPGVGVVGPAHLVRGVGLELRARTAPDGVEHVVERHARRQVGFQNPFAGGEGFKGDSDIMVAGGLIACERARVAADIGQMRRQAG